jgi:hypothetical protein
MNAIWENVIKWSEVWGILIPLAIIIRHRIKTTEMRPVILYVWIAAVLNIISITVAVFYKDVPAWLPKNPILYNIHTVARVILFSWFIINTKLLKAFWLFKMVIPVYVLFVLFNFVVLLDSPFSFNSKLPPAESIILLSLCISFFLYSIKDDSDTIWMEQPAFIVCTGVSLYEAISFFVFLFFDALSKDNYEFGIVTMKIFSISYVALCILLAVALLRSHRQTKKINVVT